MYYFGMMLNFVTVYLLAGLGSQISIKTGEINLGGEGLIYAGGFICAIILNWCKKMAIPAFFALPLSIIPSCLVGALLVCLCEFLRAKRNASFLLTTFLLSAAIIPLIDGLITGPFRTTSGNLLATPYIDPAYRFPSILKPSPFNGSIFIALIVCIALELFFSKTRFGKEIEIYGISKEFALYSGFNCSYITYSAAALSGALHALSGAVMICGTYYACHVGFYSGLGWNALTAAMIAGKRPILLIPSALIVSVIMTYSSQYALYSSLDFDINMIIQSVILFIISIPLIRGKKNA